MSAHKTPAERRQQIVTAAAKCFAEKGYFAASMDDVVALSGMSKGGVYWHFKTKRDLLLAVCDAWWNVVRDGMTRVQREGTTAGDRLRGLFLAVGRGAAAQPELARVYAEGLLVAGRDPVITAWGRAVYDESHNYISEVLTSGISRGEFRPQPVETVASQIVAVLDGAIAQRPILTGHSREPLQWNVVANSILIMLQP